MKILRDKRCVIGEGPIWNEREGRLYYTNGWNGNELCLYDPKTDEVTVRALPFDAAAFAFDIQNGVLLSHAGGVHRLEEDGRVTPIYDESIYQIAYANDMKVGPDGALYVGTQSGKRWGISDEIDGKLYRISPSGEVRVLLDGLILSNGMEWSMDETKFYHTDSDTRFIKEYDFDRATGEIAFTGREVSLKGVDGFTIGYDGLLYVGCWGQGHLALVDTADMRVVDHIETPCRIPTSCGFCGEGMDVLAITTASLRADLEADPSAGYTLLHKTATRGRRPYLFG